ncbi:AAA family ATPase [Burkholderiaceae bacterium FT117]|uniref:AAA family ATPase n=1 Tax=Zeimonas sediminis TaxID=2944268 RepID=UPI0023431A61|nr:AAA family ATPase [Zeimonas sediminis]MCM5571593.1 AAA family ATPase [Zeimonas sediminis]
MDGRDDGIRIRLLGDFRLAIDGAELPPQRWPNRRAAQLVQLLSLAPGRRLPREQAIDALWPQLDAEAGGANLRKAAHHARQAIGRADAVVLQGGQVSLCPSSSVEVDAARFEALADAALAAADPVACAAAADAWSGELLPDSPYEPWAEAARVRLRARYLELLRASGQWERLAEVEPTDEPAHRALMHRELAAGNRPAAIRWYFRLRRALQRSLGVPPDRDTEALYEECVAGLHPPGPAFVGRQAELVRATAWLAAPDRERAGGLVVRGPGGIGKSAFCAQLAGLARERGWTVVEADAAQARAPYAVTVATVERLLLDDRSLLDRIGAPARSVLAMLSDLAAPAAALPGPLGRHQVIGAFRRLLLAASGGRPVALVVDDAQQVDEADADLLLQLAVTGRPVHLVLGLRQPAPAPALAAGLTRLLRSRHLEAIDLGPLPDDDAAELVAQATRGSLAGELAQRVLGLAEGNPFAAIELARCADAGAGLPDSTRDAIAERLCDVDEAAMPLLERLALVADAFDAPTAAALADGDDSRAGSLLDSALDAGVLVVSGMQYRFRQELVRQALVERVAPHRRLRIHRDAARQLSDHGAPPPLVAQQWLAGGSPAEAARWLLAAARDAVRLAAYGDVLKHLGPLLEFEPGHAEALRLRAEALEAIGDPAAVAAYRAAADAAGGQDWHELRAKGALAQVKQGDPAGGLASLEGVHPVTVEGRLCEALAYSGAAALGFGDPAVGTRKAAAARRLALQSGDTASIVVASWAQAAAAHARGELHGSVWADLLETRDVPGLAVRVFDGHLCMTQRFLYGARPYPQVIEFADSIADEARRLGAARGQAFGVTLRGEAELLAGDLDAADEHLKIGGALHRRFGGAVGEALSLQRRAELALERGRRGEAADLLDEALDLARQTDIGFHLFDRIYGTRLRLATDPEAGLAALEDAQQSVRGLLETCPGCRITFAVPAAIAAARARELDLAERYGESCEYLANVVMRLPAWHAALEEVRGHLSEARGERRSAAAGRFAAAARGFRAAGHRLDAERCERLASGRADS